MRELTDAKDYLVYSSIVYSCPFKLFSLPDQFTSTQISIKNKYVQKWHPKLIRGEVEWFLVKGAF